MKGGGSEKSAKAGVGSGGKEGVREKVVKVLGGSDTTKNMGVQGGCVGYDGDSATGKRRGS